MAVEESEETTAEEKIDEGEIEEESTEEDKEEKEDPERLTELEIQPGKTAYINFYYTIDPEIEGMKDQDIKFVFEWMQENKEGKEEKHRKEEVFEYAVDALNLLTITTGGEKGWVEVGKEDEMLLEFDLGQMREVLDEAVEEELEKHEDDDASAAEARRASASEILVGWNDENGSRPLGKNDPAVIKKLKCEVETFGLKLNKFKAVPVTDDDNYGTSLKCDFQVSRNNLPGTYYGQVKASYEIKNRTYHTTQGFKVVVKQETGEIELTGKIGDSEIIMSGPASSFPRAEELSLKVSEVTQEQQEKVDEALQKKAEEEGSEIKQYKALDIKLIADGEETEPEGDVQVRFKNVELENPDEKKEAEQEKPEEQSIVKKAVRKVMSLFGVGKEEEKAEAVAETEAETKVEESEEVKAEENEKAAGTDEDKKEDEEKEESAEGGEATENSENIKVLHLDEDAVVVNEMKSEVQENGDVVMDTDHFSVYLIYITVNLPNEVSEALVTVKHYAILDEWVIQTKENNIVEARKENYYTGEENKNGIKQGSRKSEDAINAQTNKVSGKVTEQEILEINKVNGTTRTPLTEAEISKINSAVNYENLTEEKIQEILGITDPIEITKIWIIQDKDGKIAEERENYYYTGYKIQDNKRVEGGIENGTPVPDTEVLSLVEIPCEVQTTAADNDTKYYNSKLFPGSINENSQTPYAPKQTEIYSTDHVKIPNGSGTGIGKEVLIENLSKTGNYDVDSVKITNDEYYPTGATFNKSIDDGADKTIKSEIQLGINNTIEIYYKPKLGTIENPVEFHDYNVSISANKNDTNDYLKADNGRGNGKIHLGLRTRRVGINNVHLINGNQESTDINYGTLGNNYNRIGIGIWNNNGECDSAIWHHYLKQHGGAVAFNDKKEGGYTIPAENLSADTYQLTNKRKINFSRNQVDPGLFIPDDIKIKETYYNKATEKNEPETEYYAKKYFSNCSLTFDRKGDQYVLTKVIGSENNSSPKRELATDLDKIRCTIYDGRAVYSNLFWPLDTLSYGTYEKDRDPLFGGGSQGVKNGSVYDQYGFSRNDEVRGGYSDKYHNWYFGMRYDFSFKIGNYTGPMNYYFRGDDDFWLYIDGKLVKDVDIGGVHIANGAFVDVRKWLQKNGIYDENHDYEVSIFFMERGGTGSCCYMAFTLPNVKSGEPLEDSELTTYTVTKKWLDGINEYGVDEISGTINNTRPEEITVQLYQDGKKFGDKVKLKKEEQWTYTWENLPKYSEVGTNELHQYTVGEVLYGEHSYNDNYVRNPYYDFTEATTNAPGSAIITNIRHIDIPVKKEWVGSNGEETPIQVKLWKKLESIPANTVIYESLMGKSDEKSDGDLGKSDIQEVTTDNGNNTFVVLDKTEADWEKKWSPATRGQEDKKSEVPLISLSSENEWKDSTTWANMPLYELKDGEWMKVVYAVEEVDDGQLTPDREGGWYEATYRWDNVDGFIITNTFIIPVNIPIRKKCIDLGDETLSFDFEIKQANITKNSDGSITFNEYKPENIGLPNMPITVIVDKENNPGERIFTLEYNAQDFQNLSDNESCFLYYEIREQTGGGNFIYDISPYIVEIIIKKQNGKLSATPGDIWKDNEKIAKDEYIEFTNRKIVKLGITKDVALGGDQNFDFGFSAEITLPADKTDFELPSSDDSNSWYDAQGTLKDFTCIKKNGIITVSFSLTHGSKVIIPVPLGSKVTIKETSHAGYNVKFSVDGTETKGDNIEIPVDKFNGSINIITVICTNTPGAILPDTGGPGLLMMNRLGWMLLLLALLMAGMEIQFYGERRNRKTANVQREDSRGFDPDDY